MGTVTKIRDPLRGGSTLHCGIPSLESGEVERNGEGRLEDSEIERLNAEESAEYEAEEATVESEEHARREADIISMSEIRNNEDRDAHPRYNDVQLTMKLGDSVEDDAHAVAKSLTSLLSYLKSALSEVTGSSVEHMRTENEAAGQVQDAAIDTATKGNRFINACLRLNEEMKGIKHVATQLELLKQKVDQFEYQAIQYLPRQ